MKPLYVRFVINYVIASLLTFLFQTVYGWFTPGVSSWAMQTMVLYPFLGGFVVWGIIALFNWPVQRPDLLKWAYQLYHSGIATLTIASGLQGIFDIAFTVSPYVPIYWILGGLFLGIGSILLVNALKSN